MDAQHVGVATEAAGKTAGLVADYGMLVMVGTLFLAAGASALWLTVRHFNRRTSDDFVPKAQVVEVARAQAPDLFKRQARELPDLRNHRMFQTATKLMRAAEAMGNDDAVLRMARDVLVWTLRAHRDGYAELLEKVYANPAEFDARVGDAQALRATVEALQTEIDAAVRYRLVDEFHFPAKVYNAWVAAWADADDALAPAMGLAMDRDEPYQRLQAVLDAINTRCQLLPVVAAFEFSSSKWDGVEYTPADGVDAATMVGFRTGARPAPSSLFERTNRSR